MTTNTQQVGNKVPNQLLNQEILKLIQEQGSGTGLEGLLSFEERLEKSDKKLTPSELTTALEQVKTDIQNPDFLSFESGKREEKDFGFEGLGTDVIPTLSPQGDCIIPVNFRYDGQRRTILLILQVSPEGTMNVYRLPEGDNRYTMKINEVEFTYQLVAEGEKFKMQLEK